MVQFIFKRSATGSTITLNASEAINTMEKIISRMIVLKAKLSQAGQVDEEIKEEVATCKKIFQEKMSQEIVGMLENLGNGWNFESMTFPKYKGWS
jgi:hypothetical protein